MNSNDNPVVSTGRGGAGNIGHEGGGRKYIDGEIVREGVVGESHNPEYSSGRGGAGNIVASPSLGAQKTDKSHDVIPNESILSGERRDSGAHHTGRGGEGNFVNSPHHQHHEDAKGGETLLDKAKDFIQEHTGHGTK